MYDSRLGRWLSIDKLERYYPNISPYVYASNNPLFYTDPNGKILRDKNGKIIVTYDPKNKKTESMEYGRKMNNNGSYTSYVIERTYVQGVIYDNNGDEIEVTITLSTKTITKKYSINGKLLSTSSAKGNKLKEIDLVADCHGLTIANNKLWIGNYKSDKGRSENVGKLISSQQWEEVDEKDADIVVFRAAKKGDGRAKKAGEIIHSAIRKPNGKYKSNAGTYNVKDELTLEQAAGKAFGGKTMTDISKPGTVKFYKNNGDNTLDAGQGKAVPNNPDLMNYTKKQIKNTCGQ